MIRATAFAALLVLIQPSSATDWERPDPVTYEWTVKATQRAIPVVDLNGTKIRDLIRYIGNSMSIPFRFKHDIPDQLLDQQVSWQLENIRWIDLVAKIADETSSDIKIEKGLVRLIHKAPNKGAPGNPGGG